MRENPNATYSFAEVVEKAVNINDAEAFEVLAQLVSEERHYYCLVDLKSLEWIFRTRRNQLQKAI